MSSEKIKPKFCPICKKKIKKSESNFLFCSKRCELLDLGSWLRGEYKIPIKPVDFEGFEKTDEP